MALDFPSLPERLWHTLCLIIPYGLLAVFFSLDVASFQMTFFGEVRPSLLIIAIYYWSIYRPTLIPNWFVFSLGLTMDIIGNFPLGLNALIYLLINWVIADQRRVFVGQPFVTVLMGYILVLLASNGLRWGVFGFLSMQWPPLLPIGGSVLLGLFLFPLVNILLHTIHKILPYQTPGTMPPV